MIKQAITPGLVRGIIITLSISISNGSGFMAIFPLLVVIAYPLTAIFKQNNRKINLIKTVIWSIVFLAIFTKHSVVHTQNRNQANKIVSLINEYKNSAGKYPEDLVKAGISNLKHKIEIYHYSNHEDSNTPMLFYSSEFSAFMFYHYNFHKEDWISHSL